MILYSRLYNTFHIRCLADENQINRPLIKRLARRLGVVTIPDPDLEATTAAPQIRQGLEHCAQLLRHGENLLLYPSGHILRGRYEYIGPAAAADVLLQEVSEVRVVLVRTRGLWGSGFSYAGGIRPSVARVLLRGFAGLAASLLFFAPRRAVSIELLEPSDVPAGGNRQRLNRYLEEFFNVAAEPRTYVPYWIGGGKKRFLSEPAALQSQLQAGAPAAPDVADIPAYIRQAVTAYLCKAASVSTVSDQDDLGRDLGLDSLSRAELAVWLTQQFGCPVVDGGRLRTVADVLIAAHGQGGGSSAQIAIPPPRWFAKSLLPASPPGLADMNICEAFLYQARRSPDRPIMADAAGAGGSAKPSMRTYRDVVAAIDALRAPCRASTATDWASCCPPPSPPTSPI